MRRLRKIRVEGYRSLRTVGANDALSDLGAVTVLIGPNGAGKSNLLSFLRMVSMINTQSLRNFVGDSGGASSLLHYGPKETKEIRFELQFEVDDAIRTYEARLGHASGDQLLFLEEHCSVQRPPSRGRSSIRRDIFDLGAGHFESPLKELANPTAKAVNRYLSRCNFFHFHDTSRTGPLRLFARKADGNYLKSFGQNLPAVLWTLKLSEDPESRAAWHRILGSLRLVAPFIKDLIPEGPSEAQDALLLTWTDERDEVFGPQHLSDGTLRALAIITALSQPVGRLPHFLTIDEPELGLHPVAIQVVCELIRSVASFCQVLVSTQSPALLDHFEPEEVVVVERSHGASTFRRLEPSALVEWREEYSLSELYDKNVLGGRP